MWPFATIEVKSVVGRSSIFINILTSSTRHRLNVSALGSKNKNIIQTMQTLELTHAE